jgi:hypothetical protein
MSDALNFTEIDRQHIELLPARTVMSMFRTGTSTGSNSAGGAGASGGKDGGNVLDLVKNMTVADLFKALFGGK